MSVVGEGCTRSGDWQLRRSWPADAPSARVLLLHGLNEHSGRYEHVGRQLSAAGLDVRAHDHRGHGRTWGRRSYVESFSGFLDDVEDHLGDLRAESPELPLVLIGHSMGGLIAHAYCVDERPLPDLLVSSGAVLRSVGVPGWQKKLAPLLARFAPKVNVGGKIDGSILSRDPAVGEAYAADPLVQTGVTAALGQAFFDGMRLVEQKLSTLSIPTLALHGGADALVAPEATEMLEALPGVERRVIPGMRHEIFNEYGHEELVDDVVLWIRTGVDSLP
ncbi:MAG: alpha/beta hydrolase [Acidimicrobiales bacterium]|jgi:acylglycerol lipase